MTRGRFAAILCLLMVIGLSLSAANWPHREATSEPAMPLLPWEAAGIESLSVALGGGRVHRLARESGGWMIAFVGSNGNEVRWPASPERVQAAFRLLEAAGRIASDEPAPDERRGADVRIDHTDGRWVRFVFTGDSLGGLAGVHVSQGSRESQGPNAFALTTADAGALFAVSGLLGWCDDAPWGESADESTRVEVRSGGRTLEAARVRGAWGLVRPVAALAESDRIAAMLAELGMLRTARMSVDTGTPELPDEAGTSIGVWSERRVAADDGAVATERTARTVRIVGATPDGTRVACVATIEQIAEGGRRELAAGPMMMELDAASLLHAVKAPEYYISHRAARVPPGDVHGLAVETPKGTRLEFRRSIDGWEGGTGEASGAESVARLFGEVSAASVVIVEEGMPAGWHAIARVTLRNRDGLDMESMDVGLADAPPGASGAHLALVGGGVARLYAPAESAAATAWLGTLTREH